MIAELATMINLKYGHSCSFEEEQWANSSRL